MRKSEPGNFAGGNKASAEKQSQMSNSGRLRVIYAGTPEFAVPALAALHEFAQVVAVYTQPDRPAGRGRKLKASAVKETALELGLPVLQPLNLRDDEVVETLAAFQADVMVVAAYGLILPKRVLELPRVGCLNIHASLLPRWRGAAPIQRAILHGDAVSGASIMQMAEGLDTGPVIAHCEIPIETNLTAADLHDRIAAAGSERLIEILPAWCRGELQASEQDEASVTYAEKLQKQEATIDWSLPAIDIHRKIMAFNPWPVAQTAFDSERQLRIWRSTVLSPPEAHGDKADTQALIPAAAVAGSLHSPDGERLLVKCGSGVLELIEVQLPGRKAMPSSEFLKSNPIENLVMGAH